MSKLKYIFVLLFFCISTNHVGSQEILNNYVVNVGPDKYIFTTIKDSKTEQKIIERQFKALKHWERNFAKLISSEFEKHSKYFEGRGCFESVYEITITKSGEFSISRIKSPFSTYDLFFEQDFKSLEKKKLIKFPKISNISRIKLKMTRKRDFGDEFLKKLKSNQVSSFTFGNCVDKIEKDN